jgi:hypothetical protein
MGNSLSEQEISERTEYLYKMFSLNFNKLDIGTRNGHTGYLDFIKPEELDLNDVMSGIDSSSRKFVVFKAEIELNNGKKIKTFSTLFQRYSDNDLNYHICGHYGKHLFETDGGICNDQVKMLFELLSSGTYKLNKDRLCNLRLCWKHDLFVDDGDLPESEFPKEIKIGYSD